VYVIYGLLMLLVAFVGGILIYGLFYLLVNFWWLLLLAGAGAWLYFRHPGVKLKRELRRVAKSGQQQRGGIKESTAKAKADMDRIMRDWKRS
jgi:uncharacterized protein (DUF58 family)